MTNTIIDMIRVPVDEYGTMKYGISEVQQMFEAYTNLYPNHKVFAMPADITIWEDLDITSLENLVNHLNEIIKRKREQMNNLFPYRCIYG